MKRSVEATLFFGCLYFIFTFGTIPFLHGWAWVLIFATSWWAWMSVPLLIAEQETEEV